jgi:RimJ/RimL family protein N-acetyltransferase
VLNPEYPIETERLRLRPYQEADLDYLADVMARPDVVLYLYDQPYTREQAAQSVAKRVGLSSITAEGDRLLLVVEETATGRVVGDVNLAWTSRDNRQGEIGWVFHPDHRGRGFATEAGEVMLRLGFEGLGLHRIVARCDARNVASARVMVRLGMRREAHLIENEYVKGEWTDEMVYAILAPEWRERHSSAER